MLESSQKNQNQKMLAVLLLNRMSVKRSMVKRRSVKTKAKQKTKEEKKPPETVYCRTCLSTEDLVSIFYNKETEKKRTDDLRLVTGLEIKMDDGLSQKICTRCIEIMNTALQFRRTSKKAEKTLLSMSHGKKKKKKYSTKVLNVKTKIPKAEKRKAAEVLEEDDTYDYDFFGDDFQDDHNYLIKAEESKPIIKQNLEQNNDGYSPFLFSKKPAVKKKRVVIPNAPSYKCSTCNKEFRMKATYKAHMRFHTNYCVCESCGKRCRNNNQLQEHKRARHGLGRIHKCAYCEYSSATKEALTIHERRHTGERPYICDHCGASFHRRSNLVQHIAIHLPEKNFQCDMCPKRLKSRKFLQIHKHNAHTGKRYGYLCPICEHRFEKPNKVRAHTRRVHGVPDEQQGPIVRVQL